MTAVCALAFGAWGWWSAQVADERLIDVLWATRQRAWSEGSPSKRGTSQRTWQARSSAPDRARVAAFMVAFAPDDGYRLAAIMEHNGAVIGAEIDPGGTRVLTWSEDGTARVWEAASGKALSAPMKHDEGVWGASFDKDGTRVLTWSVDGTARVWEAASGKPLSAPMKHDKRVVGATFDKDGRVLTWSSDGTARVWEAASGQAAERADAARQASRGRQVRQGRHARADLDRGWHGAGVGSGQRASR